MCLVGSVKEIRSNDVITMDDLPPTDGINRSRNGSRDFSGSRDRKISADGVGVSGSRSTDDFLMDEEFPDVEAVADADFPEMADMEFEIANARRSLDDDAKISFQEDQDWIVHEKKSSYFILTLLIVPGSRSILIGCSLLT